MADGVFTEDLTADERAYFDTRGENDAKEPVSAEIPTETAPETPVEAAPEPVSEAEIAPETSVETPESDEIANEKPDSVPLWALKEARERTRVLQSERKVIEEQLQAEREARVRLEERFAAMERMTAPPLPEEQPLPDPETDPLGYEQVRRTHLEREITELKQAVAATKIETEIGWINNQTAQLTSQFAAKNPDYEEALSFVKDRRREQIALLYPTANQQQVEEQVALEYGNIVRESLERLPNGSIRFRRVPAEAVYKMAKSMGFQRKEAAAPPVSTEPQVEERVEQTRRRVAASTSLSSVSGNEGSGPLDAKRLAQMSEAEFAKLLRDKPELVDRLMGA